MFAGTNVRVWQIQKLRIPRNIFSWLNLSWELYKIFFQEGQIWKGQVDSMEAPETPDMPESNKEHT